MPGTLDDLRNELTTWYLGLDPRTRGFFEAVYTEQPAVVAAALGGTQVTADELAGHGTLGAVLGVDGDADPSAFVPNIVVSGSPSAASAPVAGAPFEIVWTDWNLGAEIEAYVDQIAIFDAENNVVRQGEVPGERLGRDQSRECWFIVGPDGLGAGTYTLRIVHNAGGTEPRYVQYASRATGVSSVTDVVLTVAVDAAHAGEAGIGAGRVDPGQVARAREYFAWAASALQPQHHLVLANAFEQLVAAVPAADTEAGRRAALLAGWVADIRSVLFEDPYNIDQALGPLASAYTEVLDRFGRGEVADWELLDAANAVAEWVSTAAHAVRERFLREAGVNDPDAVANYLQRQAAGGPDWYDEEEDDEKQDVGQARPASGQAPTTEQAPTAEQQERFLAGIVAGSYPSDADESTDGGDSDDEALDMPVLQPAGAAESAGDLAGGDESSGERKYGDIVA